MDLLTEKDISLAARGMNSAWHDQAHSCNGYDWTQRPSVFLLVLPGSVSVWNVSPGPNFSLLLCSLQASSPDLSLKAGLHLGPRVEFLQVCALVHLTGRCYFHNRFLDGRSVLKSVHVTLIFPKQVGCSGLSQHQQSQEIHFPSSPGASALSSDCQKRAGAHFPALCTWDASNHVDKPKTRIFLQK